jgi:O-methyltransferase
MMSEVDYDELNKELQQAHRDKLGRSTFAIDLMQKAIGMQDISRVIHLSHYILETQDLPGDMVEFGCYKGDTSKLMSFLSNKTLYVFDSFDGLPQSAENVPGEMKMPINEFAENFVASGIRMPHIRHGWFRDLTPEHLPEKISFAHLDGDLYDSTLDSLKLIYDRLVPGAIILIDDYGHDKYWTGVKQATSEFFVDKPETVVELKGMQGTLAYKALIKKL